jgi:sacsin
VEKRKKIIKRLFLTWHPDKNPENEAEFCTKVFMFIQAKIEKLEKGTPFEPSWNFSSHSYSGSYGSYFTSWGGRARDHGNQRSSFYGGGGFSSFSWNSYRHNPQPGEATRWYNQAKADLQAASNDENEHRPSYEWACFKCHQVFYLKMFCCSLLYKLLANAVSSLLFERCTNPAKIYAKFRIKSVMI